VQDETAPWNPPAVVAWRRPVEDAVLARSAGGARPIIVQPGLLYGGDNRLIDVFFVQPGRAAGAIPYIGDGENHWALIHLDDLARLYVAALNAKAGSVYLGVAGTNPRAREVAEACAYGAGLDGKTTSITFAQAQAEMGPIADAFALDQQFTGEKARRELGWQPRHTDPLSVFSQA
jgi:nucleoside-diphosphate-sugar epimerase